MQVGNFTRDGKALVGKPKGWAMVLNATGYFAETAMLEWDGTTPAYVIFDLIHYNPSTTCSLTLYNTTDSETWSQMWSASARDVDCLPPRIWKTIRLPMTFATPGAQFALRFVYNPACGYMTCCNGVVINNLVLPAKPPAAAAAVLRTRAHPQGSIESAPAGDTDQLARPTAPVVNNVMPMCSHPLQALPTLTTA
jgi:hypothetical protein